ncbi:hypothetical protein CLOSPO_02917 [Clostridium sporogenes ATCC 15579]|nr:hypothetical protein CLOSPO_02917 [Clostridium sporogenes ATCC 15579]
MADKDGDKICIVSTDSEEQLNFWYESFTKRRRCGRIIRGQKCRKSLFEHMWKL